MTKLEISHYLQTRFGYRKPLDRDLAISIGFGAYGLPTSALFEVVGSPNRGMAVVRCSIGDLRDPRPGAVMAWVMTGTDRFVRLPFSGPTAFALAQLARAQLLNRSDNDQDL